MSQRKKIAIGLAYLFFIFILSVLLMVSGDYDISFQDFLNIFSPYSSTATRVILEHRLSIVGTAVLTGLSLPSAGFILQELFRNPLAGPSVLGISSASGLGVAVYIFLFSGGSYFFIPSEWGLVFSAFIGAVLAMLLISFFAVRIAGSSSLIIIGLLTSGFTSALVSLLEYFAPSEQIKAYILWGFGRMSGVTQGQLVVFSIAVFVGLILSYLTLAPLRKMLIGKDYAASMGVNVRALRILIFLASSILVAASTAFTGPIIFVGLIIPFVCRYVLRTSDFYFLWTVILLTGVVTMLIFSLLSIHIGKEQLPINIISSLVGTPVIIGILWKLRHRKIM